MQKSPYRIEKEDLLEKLYNTLEEDKTIIMENLITVMEEINLVAKSENYIATLRITLHENPNNFSETKENH